jgi:hypothetical protein
MQRRKRKPFLFRTCRVDGRDRPTIANTTSVECHDLTVLPPIKLEAVPAPVEVVHERALPSRD